DSRKDFCEAPRASRGCRRIALRTLVPGRYNRVTFSSRIELLLEKSRMSSAGSVTAWIGALKAGDHAAAQRLWERYYEQLVRLAREKLGGARQRAADEEDVVQSALDSFYRSAAQGRFPQLRDRDNLWPLLIVITERKAFDLLQHERRKKRGRG